MADRDYAAPGPAPEPVRILPAQASIGDATAAEMRVQLRSAQAAAAKALFAVAEMSHRLDAELHEHDHTRAAAERFRLRRDLVAAELASARVEIDRLRTEANVDREVIGDQATALQAAAEEIAKLRGFWNTCSAHRDVLLAENRVLRDRLTRAQAQCALPANHPAHEEPSS